MNRILVCVLYAFASLAAKAQNASLHGTPFQRTDFPVRWDAPTNPWPATLWNYRVAPADFAPAVISNLMAVGSFSQADKAIPYGGPDARRSYFVSKDKSKSLAITPIVRAVEYEDRASEKISVSGQTPSVTDVKRLATSMLSKLGIDSAEFATDSRGELRIGRTQRESTLVVNGVLVTNVQSRGIFFTRKVDGVVVRGVRTSVCRMEYGHEGVLLRLSLLWPRWEKTKAFSTVGTQTIADLIHAGKAVIVSLPPGVESLDWQKVKSLTITDAEAVYTGDAKNVLEARIAPYAALNARIDLGETNVTAEIHCPISTSIK
jgi:hypothetical protein